MYFLYEAGIVMARVLVRRGEQAAISKPVA
jgi:hypothetical protein